MSDEDIVAGLAETIQALRAELGTALAAGTGEALRLETGAIELELTLGLTKNAGADGGVRFGVVSFGAKGGLSSERTHRLKLTLQPVTVAADGTRQRADISGRLNQAAQ